MALVVLDDDVDDTDYLFDWDAAEPKIYTGFWTQERVDTLTQQWVYGLKSAREIAVELGCTRNAVIGKANRLFLVRQTQAKQHRDRKGRIVFVERAAA